MAESPLDGEQSVRARQSQRYDQARRPVAELAKNHPTLILTLAYLALTSVGLVYNVWLFSYFRVNIIEFSETSDFLLAAVRTPLVIILSVAPVLIAWLYLQLDRWVRRAFPSYGRWARKLEGGTMWDMDNPRARTWLWSTFVVVYAIFFTQLYAEHVANRIKRGQGRLVHVELISAGSLAPADTTLLLGTTGKFVFLYVQRLHQTRIVPVENIASISVPGKKRR